MSNTHHYSIESQPARTIPFQVPQLVSLVLPVLETEASLADALGSGRNQGAPETLRRLFSHTSIGTTRRQHNIVPNVMRTAGA
eukprot:27891-Eustigmatos_ZCMA.PRE.1